jgi:deazaflavin-dependent oxidoreductase (nitroreductase family)
MAREGKPSGLMRAAVRFPVHLYKARLGWLLGKRFLMLTHTGRKSGAERFTVLEVVDQDPAAGTYFVASGWGEKSQWLQNVEANPSAQITVGMKSSQVTAVRMTREQSEQVFIRCADMHPIAFKKLVKFMTGVEVEADEAGAKRLAKSVPVVALKSTSKAEAA